MCVWCTCVVGSVHSHAHTRVREEKAPQLDRTHREMAAKIATSFAGPSAK